MKHSEKSESANREQIARKKYREKLGKQGIERYEFRVNTEDKLAYESMAKKIAAEYSERFCKISVYGVFYLSI